MPKVKQWICSSLLVIVAVAPVLAGTKDATDSKTPAPATTTTGNPAAQPAPAANPSPSASSANVTALLGVLVMKGVLAPSEANAIRNAAPEAEFQLLVEALTRKGLVTAADLSAAVAPTPAAQPAAATPVAATPAPVAAVSSSAAQAPAPKETKPAGPVVASAVAPLRVLPLDPPVKDGLVPGFKVGAIKVTPYGFIKATVVHDTSSPNGDDFPFPGIFLNSSDVFSTGPTRDPSFHIKASSHPLRVQLRVARCRTEADAHRKNRRRF